MKPFIQKIFHRNNIYGTRGGSRTAATSKMEHFVIIVNRWKPLTIITKSSILDVAAVLDPPLGTFPTSPRCSVSSIDFNSNKYGRSDIEKSCAQSNKKEDVAAVLDPPLGTFPTSPRCSVSSIDFNSNKYGRSDIEKSCAQSNKKDKRLKNDIYEFLLDKIRIFEGRNNFKI